MIVLIGPFPYGKLPFRPPYLQRDRMQLTRWKIPKPNIEEGMTIGWPQQKTDMEKLKELLAEIKAKM